ncbi:Chaperone dnaJ-domain containing protein [Quillaja saponaria]|uniref:Chaperone dnaJ-domain containing protein n=1 Tax=Quillaja saponaria TaxID=32244 RepID=A0AAD7KZR4_QUISA|nr:Chaperone dnaJ-domain containing protein [Quillaja saponaria]KAJ7948891.1 Chaperone dnaJ-domain containing protein [Quillaja saponaria]
MVMEDIWLFKQGWQWIRSQKDAYWRRRTPVSCCRDKTAKFIERHWPMVCSACTRLGGLLRLSLLYWKDCVIRGFQSFTHLGSAMLFLIMWSCLLSLTSMYCLVYILLSMAVAGATVQYLGYTPGLFIVGLFAILILWMYANFWITGTLLLVGGYLFSLNHARLVVLMTAIYAIYCVQVRVGWHGVFLSINLAFFSNDILNFLLQRFDNLSESTHSEEQKQSETVMEDEFPEECEYSIPADESENLHSCKSSSKPASTVVDTQKEVPATKVVKEHTSSVDEMRRILNSLDHYEAIGFPRHKKVDAAILKREYHKKAMVVHPDKNMGSPLASESFKKLQCAYEVLSDSMKKREYDEQLRKEESMARSVCHKSHGTSQQENPDYRSEESRRIQCTKCGNSHIWVCTNRSKPKARWCQDCCQYHQAKDGDGWVEYRGSLVFDRPHKVEIPRAFVCAESKIFDVSEWAICQGMACRPNTHRPSFHVNMVGLEKSQRCNSSRFPWDLDAEMMLDEDEEAFELWLQQALASGLFCETSKRRKSWSPFKLPQKKGKKQWRRTSC